MSEPSTSQFRGTSTPARRARVEEIFTPSSPVTRRDLFAGRTQVLQQMLDLLQQPGRHAVVFGERAVGKTSLVTIVPEFAADPVGAVHVAVSATDTFASLWRRVGESVRLSLSRTERGLASSTFPSGTPSGLGRAGDVTTVEAASLLARMSSGAHAWVVFDDFQNAAGHVAARMRELAEVTHDAAPGATLVFAGTATSGDRLMDPSSALEPVHVVRMSVEESIEAVLRALRQLDFTAEDAVIERIGTLANGLPHVTQALARAAARVAAEANLAHVGHEHLDAAVRAVLLEATPEVEQAYEQATVRARRGIYPEILLACALSPRDAYGTFTVAGVCDTVTRIVRREVRGLTNQVGALTEEGRGAVLDKTGAAKTARYRFVDPRLEPYILMRGLEEGWTTHTTPSWLPGLPDDDERRAA